jgi:hypothetical protein
LAPRARGIGVIEFFLFHVTDAPDKCASVLRQAILASSKALLA